jgi:hypothetical protein
VNGVWAGQGDEHFYHHAACLLASLCSRRCVMRDKIGIVEALARLQGFKASSIGGILVVFKCCKWRRF